jgi:putative membrane protein
VIDIAVRVLINAIGVFAATQVVPQVDFNYGNDWWKLLAVALILALVNSYIRPIVKLLSIPVSLITLGLVAFLINGAMLLLVALASDQLGLGFRIGTFPPNLNADAIVGAIFASVVISIISTALGILNTGRRIVL